MVMEYHEQPTTSERSAGRSASGHRQSVRRLPSTSALGGRGAGSLAERVLGLQRTAGNRAVVGILQRAIRHDSESLGTVTDDTGALEGTKQKLDDVVRDVLKEAPTLATKRDEVVRLLEDFDSDDPPDIAYDTVASLAGWIAEELGVSLDEEKPTPKAKSGKAWDKEEATSSGGGEWIGKMFFPGDSYHRGVKQAVIQGIGLKHLNKVMKTKGQTNFNFWFDKDGSIYVSDNSLNTDKGRPTDYRWDGAKVVEE